MEIFICLPLLHVDESMRKRMRKSMRKRNPNLYQYYSHLFMVNTIHWNKLAMIISEWHMYAGISTDHQELKYFTLLEHTFVCLFYQHEIYSM